MAHPFELGLKLAIQPPRMSLIAMEIALPTILRSFTTNNWELENRLIIENHLVNPNRKVDFPTSFFN